MNFIKKIKKDEKGSITIYVISTLLVVLLVITTMYVGLRNKTTTQTKQIREIDKEYNTTDDDMQEAYNNAVNKTLESIKGTETTNTIVKDNLGNQIVIPAGFKVINPNNNVTDGIIIEDVSHGATAGSQFVWIPVGEVIKDSAGKKENIELKRYIFNADGTVNEELSKTEPEDHLIPVGWPYCYIDGLKNTATVNTRAKDIEDFRTKAINNHGYYIGRYEARDKDTTEERTNTSSTTNQVVCTSYNYVYNNVTQPQAATLSRKMYNESNFDSDLINSYAWDTAILFLQKFDNRTDKTTSYSRKSSLNSDFANQGTNSLEKTLQDKICNIYDMSSNCLEWSTETFEYVDVVHTSRGGSFSNAVAYTSLRNNFLINDSTIGYYSFRVILYL